MSEFSCLHGNEGYEVCEDEEVEMNAKKTKTRVCLPRLSEIK